MAAYDRLAGTRSHPPSVESYARRPSPVKGGATGALILQQKVGNRAVAKLLAPTKEVKSVQRCEDELHTGCHLRENVFSGLPQLLTLSSGAFSVGETHTMRQNVSVQLQATAAAGGGDGFDPECLHILADIMSFLHGGQVHRVGSTTITRAKALKRGIIERYTQLLVDTESLYVNHRTVAQAHPLYGSWEGHHDALEGQQRGLREALDRWRSRCGGPGGGGVPVEARNVVRMANDWATRQIPDRPTAFTEAADREPERRYTLVFGSDTLPNLLPEQALEVLRERVEKTARRIEMQSGEHELVKENRDEHSFIGWAADALGGVSMPSLMIWNEPRWWVKQARAAVSTGDVDDGVRKFAQAENTYRRSYGTYVAYKEGMEEGANTAVGVAEVVAVGAAVVFVAAGAVVIAGAVVGTAAAGASATASTTAATAAAGATGATTGTAAGGTAVLISATDSAVASAALNAAIASSQAAAPTAVAASAAGVMLWTAEDAEMAAMAP